MPGEHKVRTLLRTLRTGGSPRIAILAAFALCGLYFASWYIISHYCSSGMIFF